MKPDEPPDRSNPAMETTAFVEGVAAGGFGARDAGVVRTPRPAARAAADTADAAEERDLLARAQSGDQDAFRQLVDRHANRAFGLALRIVRDAHDAEEVAQDAFVRAWLALPRFRGEASFATWLHRIVARRAFDRLERLRGRRARETEVDAADEIAADDGRAGDLETEVRARRIGRMVGALPPAQRAAVTLYYFEGHSVEQVAAVLEMPENTVKTHLSRARAALRGAWLREEGE